MYKPCQWAVSRETGKVEANTYMEGNQDWKFSAAKTGKGGLGLYEGHPATGLRTAAWLIKIGVLEASVSCSLRLKSLDIVSQCLQPHLGNL